MVLTPARLAQLKIPTPPDVGGEAEHLELMYCWLLTLCTLSSNGDNLIFTLHSVSFFTLSGPQREEGGSQTFLSFKMVIVLPRGYTETQM